MKKKYKMLIAILLALIIILLLGFLFLHKNNSTGDKMKSETTKTSKNDTKKDVSDSKYTIPNEYVGDWYQKDKKTKIKKHCFEFPSGYKVTPTSKPMPLNVYKVKQYDAQLFYKGHLVFDGTGKARWIKDRYESDNSPYWLAKMTINGKKQTVLATINYGVVTVNTKHPTSKDYTFKIPSKDIPDKSITDLDKVANKYKDKVPSQFVGTWYDGKSESLVIDQNKARAGKQNIVLNVKKNSNGTYKLGYIENSETVSNYTVDTASYWSANYEINGKSQKVLAVVYQGDLNKDDEKINVQILTSNPTSDGISIKITRDQIGATNLKGDDSNSSNLNSDSKDNDNSSSKDAQSGPLTFKEAVYYAKKSFDPTVSFTPDFSTRYYGAEQPYGNGGWYFKDYSGAEYHVVSIDGGSKVSVKWEGFDQTKDFVIDR